MSARGGEKKDSSNQRRRTQGAEEKETLSKKLWKKM